MKGYAVGDPNLQRASEEADKNLADSTQESQVTDDQTDETSDETTDNVTEDTPEEAVEAAEPETEDWAEWSKQEGLPDSIDSPEKLAESYKSALNEMKRGQTAVKQLEQIENYLQSQGITGGIQGLIRGAIAPQREMREEPAPSSKTYFSNEPVTSVFERWKKVGRIPAESEEGFRTVATLFDEAIAPQFSLAEQVMTTAMKQVVQLRDKVRDMEWKALAPHIRNSLNRTEANTLIERGLVADYEEAAGYLAYRSGNFLRDVTSKAEQRGQEKARMKLRRSRSLRPERGNMGVKADYRKFMNPDGTWNTSKLFRSGKEGDEALAAWMKENEPK